MPGLVTHYVCGEATLRQLPEARRAILEQHREMYNIGTQGPDIYFYYFPMFVRTKFFGLGNKMHDGSSAKFITYVLSQVRQMPLELKRSALSYLCGYLTHYALDADAHPYVYYRSGFKREGERAPKLRYSVNHRKFELAIDTLILKLATNEKPADKKLWQLIAADKEEAKDISLPLSRAINKIYHVPISGKQVYHSMRYMEFATRILQSKTGRRKKFVQFVEDLTIGEHVLSSLIHSNAVKDGMDCLNLKKSGWHMPWDNETTHNTRFTDLYNTAIEESAMMITAMFDYIERKIDEGELMNIIGNRSLTTGVDAGEHVEFKYHSAVLKRKLNKKKNA